VNSAEHLMRDHLLRPLRWVGKMIVSVWSRAMGNGVTGTASQFAYNAFLATIPFLFVLVTAIRIAGPDSYTTFFEKLEETIPGISGLAESFTRATKAGAAGSLVIVLASVAGLYVSSNAIGALVDGLDRAQRIAHRRWIRAKAYNMLLSAGAIVLAAVGVVSLSGGKSVIEAITKFLGGGADVQRWVNALTLPIGLTMIFVFTLLLYRFGPNDMRLRFREILPGALLSTGAWWVTNELVSLYANVVGNLAAVYGTLGALFVYLTFLYFSGLMFLVGAELNAELIHRRLQRGTRAQLTAAVEPVVGDDQPTLVGRPTADPAGVAGAGPTREIEWP
jgi:membrane protein